MYTARKTLFHIPTCPTDTSVHSLDIVIHMTRLKFVCCDEIIEMNDDQECLPTLRIFLLTIFKLKQMVKITIALMKYKWK